MELKFFCLGGPPHPPIPPHRDLKISNSSIWTQIFSRACGALSCTVYSHLSRRVYAIIVIHEGYRCAYAYVLCVAVQMKASISEGYKRVAAHAKMLCHYTHYENQLPNGTNALQSMLKSYLTIGIVCLLCCENHLPRGTNASLSMLKCYFDLQV